MAILNGLIKKMSGSAGQLTFKTVNGRTVVSEKVTKVRNTRTKGQQRQRMKWVNIVRMYAGLVPLLKNAFERKAQYHTDYNMFVRANSVAAPVYLTKAESDGGACIAAPYQITQGTLPSISVKGTGDKAVTSINLGGLAIDENTTVKDFAKAVVTNNPEFDYGDQISFYKVLQRLNAETQIPYCAFSASYVVLDKESTAKLWDLVDKVGFAAKEGFLAHGADDGDGVFAWVHSRNDYGKTKVSTQYLIDNNSMLQAYKTDDAFTKACKSYGSSADVFLTPDGNGSVAPVTPAVPDVTPSDGKFEVKLLANPSVGGTVTGAGRYPAGQSVEISASPAEGYQFNRWSDGDTNASRSITLSSNTALTAYFKSDSDTGEQEPGGGGLEG